MRIEKLKKSKKNNSSKSKGEEREIYFMIYYQRNQKENQSDFTFSEECDISPTKILDKEVKTSNDKYIYKKVFKFKNTGSNKKKC